MATPTNQQVAFMVRALLGLAETPPSDAADALAIGMAHLQASDPAQSANCSNAGSSDRGGDHRIAMPSFNQCPLLKSSISPNPSTYEAGLRLQEQHVARHPRRHRRRHHPPARAPAGLHHRPPARPILPARSRLAALPRSRDQPRRPGDLPRPRPACRLSDSRSQLRAAGTCTNTCGNSKTRSSAPAPRSA